MSIFNQFITLNVTLDTSLPALNMISGGYLNIIKYAIIWCQNEMLNNTSNFNLSQHNNFKT